MDETIKPEHFHRVNNDVNGNPRYVLHFVWLNTAEESADWDWNKGNPVLRHHACALKRAHRFGGAKYRAKAIGGGIVFSSYNLQRLCDKLNAAVGRGVQA